MQLFNSKDHYGVVSKTLHWLIFILVLAMLVGGFLMDDVPKVYKGIVFNLHKLTGLLILSLMVVRLIWALINVKPGLPAGTPAWHRHSERLVHSLMYFFIIAMPLAGWIGSSAAGKPPHLGDANLLLPVTQSKDLAETAFDAHELIAYAIIILVCVHIGAALYHHYLKKDNILTRMLPRG